MPDPEKAKEKNTEACVRMHNLIREISKKPIIDPYKRGPAYVPPKPSSLNKMWMKIKSFMDRIQIKGKK